MFKIDFQKNPETQKSVKVMVPVSTEAEFRTLRNSARNVECLRKVRQMYAEYLEALKEGLTPEAQTDWDNKLRNAKAKLLQFNYSCIPSDNMHLRGSKLYSPYVGSDVDFEPADPDFEQKMAEAPARILAMKEQLGLVMLEKSAGKGLHIVFRRRTDLSQEGNLMWASQLIGCKYDEKAKDITRVFYSTSASDDDLLYLSPDLFLPEANQPVGQQTPMPAPVAQEAAANTCQQPATEAEPDPSAYTYQGFTFAQIIDKYWELYNEGKTPQQGAREALTYELSMNLRCIADFSFERLRNIIPRYDGLPEEERLKAINSAVSAERKGMAYRMRQVLKALKDSQAKKLPGGMNRNEPPLYTGRYPEPLAKIAATTPEHLKSTVTEASFAALATHLHGVTFQLIDGKVCEPALMQILIYRQGRGKGCVDDPIDCIIADLMEQDNDARRREQEYKQNNPTGKKKKPRPQDLYIQICQPDMTNAAFVQRLIDANNNGQRPLFTHMQELDEISALSSKGKADFTLIIRKAFDRANYGQERVGSDSVTGVAPLRWNFTAATTPIRARQICTSWVSDGTLSRCNLLTIDPNDSGQPLYKPITQQYKDALKPYIERLNNAQGLIRCPKAERLARRLRDSLADEFAATDSNALETLSPRAITIAYYKAMILYIMQGKWTRDIEAYIGWSLRRDLLVKLYRFGRKLEDEIEAEQNMQTYQPRNVLEALPDSFSEEQFCKKRTELGLRGNAKEHLKKLRQRHKIDYDDTIQMYVKSVA